MASAGVKLRAIAWTAFQETLRRKVFYLVAFVALFVIAGIAAGSVTVGMATDAGETEIVSSLRTDTVRQILGIWEFAVGAMALYLGAIGLASEINGRTLVHVLSRPVDAATYLTGRWLGALGFLWGFQGIGVAFAVVATFGYHVPHTPALWFACVAMFVGALFYSGVSLGLSVVMPPMAAGIVTLVLTILPAMSGDTLKHPNWFARALSYAGYYLGPAQMPVDLTGESFTKQLVHPDYGLYARVMGENALYAVVVFAIGCMLFARRDVKQR